MKFTLSHVWELLFEKMLHPLGAVLLLSAAGTRIDYVEMAQVNKPRRINIMCGIENCSPTGASELLSGRATSEYKAQRHLAALLSGFNSDCLTSYKAFLENLISDSISAKMCLEYTSFRPQDCPASAEQREQLANLLSGREEVYAYHKKNCLETLCKEIKQSFCALLAEYGIAQTAVTCENAVALLALISAVAVKEIQTVGVNAKDTEKIDAAKNELDLTLARFVKDCGIGTGGSDSTAEKGYFSRIFEEFRIHKTRDGDGAALREFSDIYIFPRFSADAGESSELATPFSGDNFRALVRAGSGIGKTMLVRALALSFAAQKLGKSGEVSEHTAEKCRRLQELCFGGERDLLPVIVEAKEANRREYETVADLALFAECDGFSALIDSAHQSGRLLLLVDAIDEVEKEKSDRFLNLLSDFVSKYSKCNIIVTSRFGGRVKKLDSFSHVYIKRFDIAAVEAAVRCVMADGARAEDFCRAIRGKKYWLEIVSNPFMLNVAIQNPDEYTCGLLKAIVSNIIDIRWENIKNLSIFNDNLRKLRIFLGYAAWHMLLSGAEYIERDELKRLLVKANEQWCAWYGTTPSREDIRDLEDFTRRVSSESGILDLIEDGADEHYHFQSKLVMYYLAGGYFAKVCEENPISRLTPWQNAQKLYDFCDFLGIDAAFEEWSIGAVLSLLMGASDVSEQYQTAVLYFLIFKGSVSQSEEEILAICEGLCDLISKNLGHLRIANRNNKGELTAEAKSILRFVKGADSTAYEKLIEELK